MFEETICIYFELNLIVEMVSTINHYFNTNNKQLQATKIIMNISNVFFFFK